MPLHWGTDRVLILTHTVPFVARLALLQPSFTHVHPTWTGDPNPRRLTFQPDHRSPDGTGTPEMP